MKNSTELSNDKLQEGVSPSLATIYAGLAELADALDLGSSVNSCGFESHIPHQKLNNTLRRAIQKSSECQRAPIMWWKK